MVKRATGLGGMCLARSLTLWTLLRRRGVETELRVGYRKRDEKIEGHAWLEYEGVSINEGAATIQTYTVSAGPVAFDAWRQIQSGLSRDTAPHRVDALKQSGYGSVIPTCALSRRKNKDWGMTNDDESSQP